MGNIRDIRIADYDYDLPDERIPRHPLAERDRCKLLVRHTSGEIEHRIFADLPTLLAPDTLLVCNNTRVINARIKFRKSTGAEIEVFLLEPIEPADYALMFASTGHCRWNCIVGNLKRWKEGALEKSLEIGGSKVTLRAHRIRPLDGNAHEVELSWDPPRFTLADIIEAAGYIPIPPYLRRQSEQSDSTDYQTVYSRIKGSVAAPTAGLHFTPTLLRALTDRGISREELTLHVGAGTFQPVKSETIGDHPMHTETFSVTLSLVDKLIEALKGGHPVCAVGTTTVRTLESLPYLGRHIAKGGTDMHVSQWEAYAETESADETQTDTIKALESLSNYLAENGTDDITASTAIMIAPGFRWRIVNRMVTNFHQPQSTLLLLVSSFLGEKVESGIESQWREVYSQALDNGYRFLSYGDACLFEKA